MEIVPVPKIAGDSDGRLSGEMYGLNLLRWNDVSHFLSFNLRVADTGSPLTQNLNRKKDPDAIYV